MLTGFVIDGALGVCIAPFVPDNSSKLIYEVSRP